MSSRTGGQIPSFCGTGTCFDGAAVYSQVGSPFPFCPPPCLIANEVQRFGTLGDLPTTLPSPWPLA